MATRRARRNWTPLPFGKHAGKTLPQVVFNDPDWFFWAYGERALHKDTLGAEADYVHQRARHIRLPDMNGHVTKARYIVHPLEGGLAVFELVPVSQPPHDGSSPTFDRDVIDMGFPREAIREYDKLGNRIFVDALRYYLFGDRNARLTKARCEAFFEDDENFRLD